MSKDLTVIDQREVTFYNDQLTAVRGGDSQVYVPVTQMCRALGLDERSQRRRIQNHTILSEGYTRGDISTPPVQGVCILAPPEAKAIRLRVESPFRARKSGPEGLSSRSRGVHASAKLAIKRVCKHPTPPLLQAAAVAIAQGRQTKQNEFGGVYGELYRKFEITSYKLLPASKFDEAMKFLTEWHISLTGDSPF